jgi:ribosomal protein L11 methyltransferase
MTVHLLFKVKLSQRLEALKFLEPLAGQTLYELKQTRQLFLGGFFPQIPTHLPEYLSCYTQEPMSVDWTKQWETFCPHMDQQCLTLDLSPYGLDKRIFLTPGPGFGDLSHPTTNLCLQHLPKLCADKLVVDFGSGSGILSVAAWAFGASRVYCIEIDPDSLAHTKQNLALNHYPTTDVQTQLPQLTQPVLCLINMTFKEQKIALQEVSNFPQETLFISSGILKTQLLEYLKWAKTVGLNLTLLDQLDGWVICTGTTFKHSGAL